MMRIVWIVGVVLACMMLGDLAVAKERHPEPVTTVTACGEAAADEANARDKAIGDALRNAVMAGIGAYVDSTTIGENYEEVKDEMLVKASGFATLVKVESSSVSDGIMRVKITANVSNRPLAAKLKELGLTHEWKVGVFIPENYASKTIPDPASETAVIQKLLKAGFRVIDESQRQRLMRDESAKRAAEGDLAALQSISREYDVDVFVTGKAFAEYVDESKEGGVTFYRARGRIETKIYYTDTGELISVNDAFGDGIDQAEGLASKQCFKSLGASVGTKIVDDIMVAPAELNPFVAVKLMNIKSMSQASELEKAIDSLKGVTKVSRSRFTSGVLELDVYVKSEYRDELPENIENCAVAKRIRLLIDSWSKSYVQGRAAKG